MITGKDVYSIAITYLQKQGLERMEWDAVDPITQAFYVELAEKLNQQFIGPLLQLVKDYQRLVEQRIGTLNAVPPAGWSDKAIELEARAKTLIGEEK